MKRILVITFLLAGMLSSSCSKWLDVKPEDRFIEDEVYKNPQGFMDAINGIYLDMGSSGLYGFQLPLANLDLLAQYYYISPSHSPNKQQLVVYNYKDGNAMAQIDMFWTKMYKNILAINSFLENLEERGNVLDETTFALFKGEALALRAYLYLDLLRMFTPNYINNSSAEILPYSDQANSNPSPYRSSAYVMERIQDDLAKAETLLEAHDPAIQQKVVDVTNSSFDFSNKSYLSYRNYRLNYYAVLALQARTYLWKGEKEQALKAAEKVIAVKSKFPWITPAQVNSPSSPNRVFSTEMIFGFENPKLYDAYKQNFSATLQSESTLFAGHTNAFLNRIFDNWELDLRFKPMWAPDEDKTYSVFLKYKDITSIVGMNFRYTVPGITLSEIFLIAAECEPDQDKGLAYLNELRQNRNCLPIGNSLSLEEDIMKEARKEFWGLGQMWFFYKRHNYDGILAATTVSEIAVKPMDYVFPLPYSETEPR